MAPPQSQPSVAMAVGQLTLPVSAHTGGGGGGGGGCSEYMYEQHPSETGHARPVLIVHFLSRPSATPAMPITSAVS